MCTIVDIYADPLGFSPKIFSHWVFHIVTTEFLSVQVRSAIFISYVDKITIFIFSALFEKRSKNFDEEEEDSQNLSRGDVEYSITSTCVF